MERTKITLMLPGSNRRFAPDVILTDLARKLRDLDLSSGVHEINIHVDGSITVDGMTQWKPKPSAVAAQPKQKVVKT